MKTKLAQVLAQVDFNTISEERKVVLSEVATYVQNKRDEGLIPVLNFVCTHNSRRSQFSQVWAAVAANHYGIELESHSSGVEVTACNERTIASLIRFGFDITSKGDEENPVYRVAITESSSDTMLELYSKVLEEIPSGQFAAIMTCSHADENCPFIPGAEARIAVRYEDPKKYDDTPLEMCFYDYRSFQIATEMMYLFSKVK